MWYMLNITFRLSYCTTVLVPTYPSVGSRHESISTVTSCEPTRELLPIDMGESSAILDDIQQVLFLECTAFIIFAVPAVTSFPAMPLGGRTPTVARKSSG
jgi:hypothetical protein